MTTVTASHVREVGSASGFAGRLASVTQLVFAGLIGGISALAGDLSPDFVPRWLVLVLVYGLPGVIGLLGVLARRPMLLIAAGLTSGAGAVVAMSGVTLIFLVPAILFLYGSARVTEPSRGARRGSWANSLVQVGLAAAIIVLVVGAGASALLNTDSACWTEYRTPAGARIVLMPFSTEGVAVPVGASSVSCSTGLISVRGVGLAGVLAGSALALAAVGSWQRASGQTGSPSSRRSETSPA